MKKLLIFFLLVPCIADAWLSPNWQYRKRHYIDSLSGAGTNYQIRLTVKFDSGPVIRGADMPVCRQDFIKYDEHGDSLIFEHDILNDPDHDYEAITLRPDCQADLGEWSGPGGPSIYKDGSTYYLAVRQRCSDENRGKFWELYSSTNLSDWDTVWTVDRTAVSNPPHSLVTLEGVSFRKFSGYYYFYFCTGDGATWYTYWISSTTLAGLKTKLLDGTQWNEIFTDGNSHQDKDPQVYYMEPYYYCANQHQDTSHTWLRTRLVRSNSPGFGTYDTLCYISKVYSDEYGGATNLRGTTFYDEDASCFIYWGTAEDYTTSIWWWAVSYDLVNWRVIDTLHVCAGTDQVTARYMDYYALDDGRLVLAMEWDHDQNDTISTWIWDYTGDTQGQTAQRPHSGGGMTVYMGKLCQSDFDDIRFTDNTGDNLLDHYCERMFDEDSAVFWVEVQGNLSTDSQYIYIYYGYSSATSASSGGNTFYDFDDFEGYEHNDPLSGLWSEYNVDSSHGFARADTVHLEEEKIPKYQGIVAGKDTTDGQRWECERNIPDLASSAYQFDFWFFAYDTSMRADFGPRSASGYNNLQYGPHLKLAETGDEIAAYYGATWNNLCEFEYDVWNHVQLCDFDFTGTGTFDLVFNGVLVGDNISFRNDINSFDWFHVFRSTADDVMKIEKDLWLIRKWAEAGEPEQRSWGIKEQLSPDTKIIVVN